MSYVHIPFNRFLRPVSSWKEKTPILTKTLVSLFHPLSFEQPKLQRSAGEALSISAVASVVYCLRMHSCYRSLLVLLVWSAPSSVCLCLSFSVVVCCSSRTLRLCACCFLLRKIKFRHARSEARSSQVKSRSAICAGAGTHGSGRSALARMAVAVAAVAVCSVPMHDRARAQIPHKDHSDSQLRDLTFNLNI